MTDSFQMHDTFPMDQAYIDKARKRGFDREAALKEFDGFKAYWIAQGKSRTPRGWLQCWDNRLAAQAQHRATCNGMPRNRFERRPQNDTIIPGPRMVWVGGMGYDFLKILPLKHKQASGQPLDPDEQAALEAWNAG